MIKERLDRYVFNNEWFNRYPYSVVENISSLGSDHSPIVLNVREAELQSYDLKWGNRFHFDGFWTEYEECAKVIEDGWNPQKELIENMVGCKEGLEKRSKIKFKGRVSLLNRMKQKLVALKKQASTDSTKKEIIKVEEEIGDLLQEEEAKELKRIGLRRAIRIRGFSMLKPLIGGGIIE